MDFKTELITSLLECGFMDLDRLEEAAKAYEAMTDNDISDAIERVADWGHEGQLKYSHLMHVFLDDVTRAVADNLQERELITEEKADELRDSSPFVNFMDSWYNNELDHIEMEGKSIESVADEFLAAITNGVTA